MATLAKESKGERRSGSLVCRRRHVALVCGSCCVYVRASCVFVQSRWSGAPFDDLGVVPLLAGIREKVPVGAPFAGPFSAAGKRPPKITGKGEAQQSGITFWPAVLWPYPGRCFWSAL